MRIANLVLAVATLTACGSGAENSGDAATSAAAATAPSTAAAPAAPSPAAIAGGAMSKEELGEKVCFFTADEVRQALGFSVPAGKPQLDMASYGMFSCRYEGADNTLQINAIWVDPAQVEASRASRTQMSAGDLEHIAGDPDGAYLQYQQELGGALHYMRRNVMIEIRPMSWREGNAAMKAKLLSLRRVP